MKCSIKLSHTGLPHASPLPLNSALLISYFLLSSPFSLKNLGRRGKTLTKLVFPLAPGQFYFQAIHADLFIFLDLGLRNTFLLPLGFSTPARFCKNVNWESKFKITDVSFKAPFQIARMANMPHHPPTML